MKELLLKLKEARRVVAVTGAGISAESGISTFRGDGGLWRRYEATSLASPSAFRANPSLVWEFYHYRRAIVEQSAPNPGHFALAQLERLFEHFLLITQNVDGLHELAGSRALIEIHGSIRKVKCSKCDYKGAWEHPICAALEQAEIRADFSASPANLSNAELPTCPLCGGLLRPDIVWFGENLDQANLDRACDAANAADVLLVIGTSSQVYPVAMIAPNAAANGTYVAEINLGATPHTGDFAVHIDGASGAVLPELIRQLQ